MNEYLLLSVTFSNENCNLNNGTRAVKAYLVLCLCVSPNLNILPPKKEEILI